MAHLSDAAREAVIAYAITILFCIGIGALLTTVSFDSMGPNLTVSLSIGLSICTLFVVFGDKLRSRLQEPFTSFLIMIIGLALGLCIGGLLVTGDPVIYFKNNLTSLFIGAFFGLIGTAVFLGRTRVTELNAKLAVARTRELEQQREVAEVGLKMLQAQIEPHFLFNTLSNAISLIHTDPDTAEELLHKLTSLLRDSLQRTRSERITLKDEMTIVEAYLRIQQIRTGDKMQYSLALPDHLEKISLPPMLLQPLVENAVIHGINDSSGVINVIAREHNSKLELSVVDNGAGISPNSSGTGTALGNIRNRLQLLYQAEASLSLLENKTGGVTARLLIPVEGLTA